MAEQQSHAERYLIHYISELWQSVGNNWNDDADAEVRSVVQLLKKEMMDELVEPELRKIRQELTTLRQQLRAGITPQK